jgi:branched-chain amino acid aminotransferase
MTAAPSNALAQGESAQGYLADPRNDGVVVYVNGDFVPRDEARVSIFDSGFVLGDGIWEGLRLIQGRLVSLDAHLDRLYEGATSIALDIGLTRTELTQAVLDTLAKNGMTDGAHIRLMVTRGVKRTPNQDPRFVIGKATIVIVAEWKTPKPESKARGLSLYTSTFRTSGPDVFDLRLNSHSRLNLIQALIQAIHAGADEALMLDPRGFVASCNSTNFFIVRKGELWTSTGAYSFKGITQRNVIEAWTAAGGVARECDFTLGAGVLGGGGVRDGNAGGRDAGDEGGWSGDRRWAAGEADGPGRGALSAAGDSVDTGLKRVRTPNVHSRARAQLAHASTEFAPQQSAQRHTVGIADLRRDPVDAVVAGAQQVHRPLDAQVLEVGQRGLAEHAAQPSRQGALAGTGRTCRVGERKAMRQLLPCPGLEALDQRIGVRQVIGDHELGLRAARFDQQVAGREGSQRGTALPDEAEREIQMCHGRAGSREGRRIDQHARLVERDFRIALAEHGSEPPGRRRALAVEQRAFREQKGAGAGRADRGAGA